MGRPWYLSHSPELSRDDLRLPFRVECNAENGLTLIAHELQDGHRSLGNFIASPQRLNDNVWSSIALRTFADHHLLLLI